MVDLEIFNVDVHESIKVTDLDLENMHQSLDQDDMGISLPPDDLTWPYQSNSENEQVHFISLHMVACC